MLAMVMTMMMMDDMTVKMTKWIIINMVVDTVADFEDVSGDSLVSAPTRGAAEGISWARSGPDCGDVSGGLPVWGPNILRFPSRVVSEDVSGEAVVSALPGGPNEPPGAPRMLYRGASHEPFRAQIVGMSQTVCLFGGLDFGAFRTDCEDAPGAPRKLYMGGISWALSGPDCGDVSSGLLVCVLNISRFRSSLGGCLRRGAGFSTREGGGRGVLRGPVRAQIVGMSQAVCLFGCPTSLAFGADWEDVSGEALVSALRRGVALGSGRRRRRRKEEEGGGIWVLRRGGGGGEVE